MNRLAKSNLSKRKPMNNTAYQKREGTLGWSQFLTARKELLDTFDTERTKAKAHEVETYHGVAAEAEFRKWLSSFLPKRYGVTKGYIVSQGRPDTDTLPEFDVIIFDALESPILWVEDGAGE